MSTPQAIALGLAMCGGSAGIGWVAIRLQLRLERRKRER